MSTTLEEIEAAYMVARYRVFHSGARGAATPEQWQAWKQEFRDAIAKVKAEAQVEALEDLATAHYLDGSQSTYDTIMRRADRIARVAGIETGENDER